MGKSDRFLVDPRHPGPPSQRLRDGRQNRPILRRPAPLLTRAAAHWPWILAAAFAAAVSGVKLAQHFSLQTQTYDLGIYANLLWNSLHGRPYWVGFAGFHY